MSTFFQRFQQFIEVTDPTTLFYSKDKILEAKRNIENDPYGRKNSLDEKLVKAAVHPVTGEVIPRLFRVSAIAPVNIPLVFAMIACPPTNVPGTLFLHWLNQSYNTACNYFNRSGSSKSSDQILQAYVLAVSSACGFAYGLGKVFSRMPAKWKTVSSIIPCFATAAANVSNIAFTRLDEMQTGITVFDKHDNVICYTISSELLSSLLLHYYLLILIR